MKSQLLNSSWYDSRGTSVLLALLAVLAAMTLIMMMMMISVN